MLQNRFSWKTNTVHMWSNFADQRVLTLIFVCPNYVRFLFTQNKSVCYITRCISSHRKFNDLLDSYKSEFPNKATFVLNNREATVFVPSDESLRDFTTSDIASIKKDLTVLQRVCYKEGNVLTIDSSTTSLILLSTPFI